MSLQFKFDVILVTEERKYAEDKSNQPKETPEGIKESDKLLVRALSSYEIEAKELEDEVGDGLLGDPLVRQDEDGVEEDVGGHEADEGVAEHFLLLWIDLCFMHWVHRVQEETQATAEGKTIDAKPVKRLTLK